MRFSGKQNKIHSNLKLENRSKSLQSYMVWSAHNEKYPRDSIQDIFTLAAFSKNANWACKIILYFMLSVFIIGSLVNGLRLIKGFVFYNFLVVFNYAIHTAYMCVCSVAWIFSVGLAKVFHFGASLIFTWRNVHMAANSYANRIQPALATFDSRAFFCIVFW